MANEPERPIEKLLRAFAQRRRKAASEGSGFELHPATRRLLQGEVARRFPRQEQGRGGANPWWRAAFWPRLVEACVLVALMGVVASLLVPALRTPKAGMQLARNEEARQNLERNKSLPAPAAAPAPAAPSEASRQLAERERFAAQDASKLAKEAPAAPMQENRSATDKDSLGTFADATTASPQRAPASALATRDLRAGSGVRNAPAAPAEPPTVAATTPMESAAGLAGAPMPSTDSVDRETLSLAENKNQPITTVTNAFGMSGGASGFAAQKQAAAPASGPASTLRDLSAGTNPQSDSLVASTVGDESGKAKADSLLSAKKAEGGVAFQRFAQVPALQFKALESKAGPQILTSFQVQQAGRELKVIDSDGSVYTGSVQLATLRVDAADSPSPPSAVAQRRSSGAQSVLSTTAPSATPMPMRFFRVSGTNRTLNQPVVFSGDLTSLTNLTNVGVSGRVNGALGGAQAPPGPLLNTRISGQAVIGKDKVVPVNAVPAP